MIRASAMASVAAILVASGLSASVFANLIHPTPATTFRDVLDQYCFRCHSATTPRGGVNLRDLDFDKLQDNGAVWEKVLSKMRAREMPPAGRWKPDEATYDSLANFIEAGRDHIAETSPNPGRPTLRRLNRAEYANSVRDLLAVDVDVAELLPADDMGYGFDNIGDVLSVSPVLLERYLTAAGKIARVAIGDTTTPPDFVIHEVPHGLQQTDRMSADMPLGSRGGASFSHVFPVDGEYEIAVTLQRGRFDEAMGLERERKLDLRLDGKRLELFTIAANPGGGGFGLDNDPSAGLKARVEVAAGTRELMATFAKDTIVDEGIPPRAREKAFFEGVGQITVAGPFNVKGPGASPSRDKVFICHPDKAADEAACAEKILANLAHRAYRRPVAREDIAQLTALYAKGAAEGGFEAGVRLALQKILVSPEFVFRVEYDPAGAKPGSVHNVSDVELATRLSFFLWSAPPDGELTAAAEKGTLRDPGVLEAQVRRMLKDAHAVALVENFAGQWLYLRNIPRIQPDPQSFPAFDENLRRAMGEETELLLESELRDDRSVVDLLDTDYTFVNERLARHYGIPGVYGPEFRRVSITDPKRRGLLGQASILSVTSYPNRTAPTIRGKWVMEQLLGSPPPPPPANVPSLKEDASTANMTMRERMEQHRANPSCAVCHRVMDPLGFSLENYDGLGRWRDTTGANAGGIDSSGVLPDGTKFDGPQGLREVLLAKKDRFVAAFAERLTTYALGRGVEEYDQSALRKIVHDAARDDNRWSAVVLAIVKSAPFQMRKVGDDHI
jgi:hypothetical protein